MEKENKVGKRRSNIQSMVGLATGFLPSLYYSSKVMGLMDRAGFYQLDDFGGYTNIELDILLASELGLFALLFGGLSLGFKVGGYLENKFS